MNAKLKKALALSFVYLMLAVTYIPILILVIYSFTNTKVIGMWDGFTFELYAEVFRNSEIMNALKNSLVLAVVASTLATFLGTVAAIGIYYMRGIRKRLMNFMTQITMVNAEIVTGVSFMLLFVLIRFIPSGWATLIIAHTMITTPYVILNVLPRLSQLNPNLYEAGLDLGASPVKTLFKVLLPQLIPGMISGFALAFTLSFDDFIVSKFNNGGEKIQTISTYLYTKLAKKGVQPVLRALSTIIFVVVLVVLIAINMAARRRAKKAKAQ